MEAKQQIKDFFIFNDKNWKKTAQQPLPRAQKKSMAYNLLKQKICAPHDFSKQKNPLRPRFFKPEKVYDP